MKKKYYIADLHYHSGLEFYDVLKLSKKDPDMFDETDTYVFLDEEVVKDYLKIQKEFYKLEDKIKRIRDKQNKP